MMNTEKIKETSTETRKIADRQEPAIMDIRSFAVMIKRLLKPLYPSGRVEVHEVKKNNGLKRTGISILENGCNAAPTIYLENLFSEYRNGKPLEEICRIVAGINKNSALHKNINVCSFTGFSNVQGKICYRLVNAGKNSDLLQEVPHRFYQDLAIIYYILVTKEPDGISSITIKNNMMEWWDVDENTLYETARQNTPALFNGEIMPMAETLNSILAEIPECDVEEIFGLRADSLEDMLPFYVVSNDSHINGAIAMLYDGILTEFCKKIGGDFYIIPSSIHEMIFIPILPYMEENTLLEMVREINVEHVAPEEQLSDYVYRYVAEDGCVRILG